MEKNLDLSWLKQRIPLFEKMMAETQQRHDDEMRYKRNPGYVPKMKVE